MVAPQSGTPEKRGSWKSRLTGGGSNQRRNTSSQSPRFSRESNSDADEKKDEEEEELTRSLSATRKERSQKKSVKGRLRNLLPRGNSSSKKRSEKSDINDGEDQGADHRAKMSPVDATPRNSVAGSNPKVCSPPSPLRWRGL